jgi:hypothetical protein
MILDNKLGHIETQPCPASPVFGGIVGIIDVGKDVGRDLASVVLDLKHG